MSAGYYNLTPEVLKRFRDNIVARPDAFKAILDHFAKSDFELAVEMPLTGMPKGYAEYAGEWYAQYLKFNVSWFGPGYRANPVSMAKLFKILSSTQSRVHR